MRKRRPAKTIETEVEKIRLDESAIIKYCADPLFFRVSKKFDPSKSSGLILNNIGVFHGAKVTFNSFVPEYVVKRPPLRPIPFETLVPTSLLNNLKICQSFSHVTRLDLEGAPSQNEANPTNQEADDFSDFGEPMDLWNEPPETAFANDPLENFGKENEGQEACALHANTFEGSIVGNSKFSLALSTDPYSYFDPKIFRAWSGPEHWKYHPIINKNTNETKRNPKESKLIDFSDLSKYTLDFKGSASTILSQLTLNKLCEEKNTLPKDEHYGIADLYRFFLKPRWTISKNLRGIPNLKEASFLSNEATSILNNYEEDMLDNDDGLQNETETVRRHIEKVEINYAKQPTRMDVTLLKTNILNALESKISKHEKPKFSEIFKKIPKQMPEELARNVSVPMCFVCLLHLANEKGLCIEQNDSMSDLVVSFNGA
ncbi:condensin complex subunit 2-like [Zophobas morio]|uniref:condensin complex subunit 2-like n=1 Tax=Zophobas morio TaxID=2755281 RepID=UPI0030839307